MCLCTDAALGGKRCVLALRPCVRACDTSVAFNDLTPWTAAADVYEEAFPSTQCCATAANIAGFWVPGKGRAGPSTDAATAPTLLSALLSRNTNTRSGPSATVLLRWGAAGEGGGGGGGLDGVLRDPRQIDLLIATARALLRVGRTEECLQLCQQTTDLFVRCAMPVRCPQAACQRGQWRLNAYHM